MYIRDLLHKSSHLCEVCRLTIYFFISSIMSKNNITVNYQPWFVADEQTHWRTLRIYPSHEQKHDLFAESAWIRRHDNEDLITFKLTILQTEKSITLVVVHSGCWWLSQNNSVDRVDNYLTYSWFNDEFFVLFLFYHAIFNTGQSWFCLNCQVRILPVDAFHLFSIRTVLVCEELWRTLANKGTGTLEHWNWILWQWEREPSVVLHLFSLIFSWLMMLLYVESVWKCHASVTTKSALKVNKDD